MRLLILLATLLACLEQGAGVHLCTFSGGSRCAFVETTKCYELTAPSTCLRGPNGVYFGTNADQTTANVYADPACTQLSTLLNWPTATAGQCVSATVPTGTPILDLKLFTPDIVAQCPICTLDVTNWWVCAHKDNTCSFEGGAVYCIQPKGRCVALQLSLGDFLFRTVGVRLNAPDAQAGTDASLELQNPPFTQFPTCTARLFGALWENKPTFSKSGTCFTFNNPAVESSHPRTFFLSVHEPGCKQCADHFSIADPDEGSDCTAYKTEASCRSQRACDYTNVLNIGCENQAQFALGASIGFTCGFASAQECTGGRFFHLCVVEDDQCVTRTESDFAGPYSGLAQWFYANINPVDLAFPLSTVSETAFPTDSVRMQNVHACDLVATDDQQEGFLFRGWEQWVVNSAGCDVLDLTENIEWQVWAYPTQPHEIDVVGNGDEQAGFSGQRYVVAPPLHPPDVPEGHVFMAVSLGTNGMTVYGFDEKRNISRPLLVWESPRRLPWSLYAVELYRYSLNLYVNGKLEKTEPLASDTVVHVCPDMIGWSPYGSFEGLVRLAALIRPGNVSFGGGSITDLLVSGCSVRKDSFQVTSGAPFESRPVVLQSNSFTLGSEFELSDLNNVNFSFLSSSVPGLSLDPSSGVISGVLVQPGEVVVTIGASLDSPSCSSPDDGNVTITVLPPVRAAVDVSQLDLTLTARAEFSSGSPGPILGGDGNYRFSSNALPEGLVLDPQTGELSGITSLEGEVMVSINVTDGLGGRDTFSLKLFVHPAVTLQGQPVYLTEGSPFRRPATPFSGGQAPFRFGMRVLGDNGSVPAQAFWGLTLNSQTGLLQGVPNASESGAPLGSRRRRADEELYAQVSIAVEDAQGAVATEQIALTLSPALRASVTNLTIASVAGQDLAGKQVFVSAQGGRQPYAYIISEAPSGLSVVASSGQLVGASLAAGNHVFRLGARDANGAEAFTENIVLTTSEAPLASSGDDGMSPGAIAATVVAVAFGLFVIVGLVLLRNGHKKRKHDFEEEMAALCEKATFVRGDLVTPTELDPRRIQVIDELGRGAYGVVCKAFYNDPNGSQYLVGVKQLLSDAAEARSELMHEALLMAQVHHPHVVGLIGVVTASKPEMLVMPYLENGSLKAFLKASVGVAEMSKDARWIAAVDICRGMKFLEEHGVVHRDLAARNVLVDSSHRCVVADFGRARNLNDSEYYRSRNALLPLRWMAPEALKDSTYTSKTDVYSFAMTLYEVWTNGTTPWHGKTNKEVFIAVCNGEMLDKPPLMPGALYQRLTRCWDVNETSRPTFAQLLVWLERRCAIPEQELHQWPQQQQQQQQQHQQEQQQQQQRQQEQGQEQQQPAEEQQEQRSLHELGQAERHQQQTASSSV